MFDPVPIMLRQLKKAEKEAEKARRARDRLENDKKGAKILALIEHAIGEGKITLEDIEYLKALFPEEPMVSFEEDQDSPALEFGLTPLWKIVLRRDGMLVVQAPYGVGYVPDVQGVPHSSFQCGHCGSYGPWQGARCMTCGYLSDD